MTANLLKLCELSRVEEVVLAREGEELILRLRLIAEPGGEQTAFTFHDVRDLRFRSQPIDLGGLVVLMKENVINHGWDKVRFRIKDYEEEFISFYCRDYSSM